MRLSAWARRPEVVAELLATPGLVDSASTEVTEVIAGADCLLLAMPTGNMAEVVARMPAFPPGSRVLVTDVGSVKTTVVREIAPLVTSRGGVFIGSHPMAGSEKKGLCFAEADLFEKAAVILTPTEDGDPDDAPLRRLRDFWESLGGVVTLLPPERHDELVGAISHLPHLVAAALSRSVLGRIPEAAPLSGGGFRDTTRVAGGPEAMWAGILSDNHLAVSEQLGELIRELEMWKETLDTLDRDRLLSFLSEARALRTAL
ncbi:MAG: prephenate dehydrogenase/arogenate dehydrogenase family protein [Verrucomicrobiaceae bacterium]|nr:prephenate dehydrogenase/arogenate dehydrogenase family protein [Verrucomicrobiaceae bacterium]